MAEQCEDLQGFLVFDSVGGGTGSGLGSLILQKLSTLYPRQVKLAFTLYPSPSTCPQILSPYNTLLSLHSMIDHTNINTILGNDAIENICKTTLQIPVPTFLNMNRLVAQAISNLTASARFDGALCGNLSEFQTGLVPFPRFNFQVLSHAPIVSVDKNRDIDMSLTEITSLLFDK